MRDPSSPIILHFTTLVKEKKKSLCPVLSYVPRAETVITSITWLANRPIYDTTSLYILEMSIGRSWDRLNALQLQPNHLFWVGWFFFFNIQPSEICYRLVRGKVIQKHLGYTLPTGGWVTSLGQILLNPACPCFLLVSLEVGHLFFSSAEKKSSFFFC